ncbi:hypothetical protein [Shewanella sp. Isolate7]|uniref:hypothetical protein n=1 Tax=Shewanella sp. Isolate7 TaxID=2908528 RepID=UPI001EFD9829|nr:hypothetical protein [Shewanella sp. Isolate7]MCG9722377.1 hypothetical protein [Shewanella sp. Isolate7]
MKTSIQTSLVAVSALLLSLSVQAHDPKEHMTKDEQPDCSSIMQMDQSQMHMNQDQMHKDQSQMHMNKEDMHKDQHQMDMDDPVMQALRKKCMKEQQEKDDHHKMEQHDKGHSHG